MYLPRVNWLKLDCLKERLAARWNHFFYWLHTADSRRGPETQNNQQAVAQKLWKGNFGTFFYAGLVACTEIKFIQLILRQHIIVKNYTFEDMSQKDEKVVQRH